MTRSSSGVAPLAGARIEISWAADAFQAATVAPLAGARIEIDIDPRELDDMRGRPSRRGEN